MYVVDSGCIVPKQELAQVGKAQSSTFAVDGMGMFHSHGLVTQLVAPLAYPHWREVVHTRCKGKGARRPTSLGLGLGFEFECLPIKQPGVAGAEIESHGHAIHTSLS